MISPGRGRFLLVASLTAIALGLLLHFSSFVRPVSAQTAQPVPTAAPADLFRKALHPSVVYEGVAVVVTRNSSAVTTDRLRVYHALDNTIRREYVALDGKRHDVYIQAASWFVYWRADANPVIVRKYPLGPRPEPLENADVVLRNYEVLSEGPDSVAGRPALKLRLRSRFGARPDVCIWVDSARSLILRESRLDLAGVPLVDRYFEEIRFPDSLDPSLFAPPAGAFVEDMAPYIAKSLPASSARPGDLLADFRSAQPDKLWLPATLPPGFELTSVSVSPGVLHLGYSDGLAALSVFVQSAPTDAMLAGEKSAPVPPVELTWKGVLVSDFSRGSQTILRRTDRGRSLVVIGEISRADLLDLLVSLRPASDSR